MSCMSFSALNADRTDSVESADSITYWRKL